MRKTQDDYVKPQETYLVENPTRWKFTPKKTPEAFFVVDTDDFRGRIIERVIEITNGVYKQISCDILGTACSVLLDDRDFGHISYNLLFPEHKVTGEK